MTICECEIRAAKWRVHHRRKKRQWKEWQRGLCSLARREAEKRHDPVGDTLDHYEATRSFKEVVSRRLH